MREFEKKMTGRVKKVTLADTTAVTFKPYEKPTEEELKLARQVYKWKDNQALGPDAYKVVYPQSAPVYSFGSKFGSRVGNKEHLRPTKIDGPGPGSYKMPKQY